MDESMIQDIEEIFKGRAFLTIEDITQLLSCSPSVVYNWIKRAEPQRRPPRIIVGNESRFPKRKFIRWLLQEQATKGS